MSQDKEPRRRFLRQVLAIVPAATTLGGATTVAVSQPAMADSSEPGKPRAYTPTYFTAPEWAFLNAAVDHLIPSDQYGAGALETGVPEFIDRQMETPYGAGKLWYMQGPFHPDSVPELGYQLSLVPRDIYRQGIAACNDWCSKNHGKVFAELDKAKQLEVLKMMEGGKIASIPCPPRPSSASCWATPRRAISPIRCTAATRRWAAGRWSVSPARAPTTPTGSTSTT
jgi:gluconate 2-dehydrogenase gamma chain